MRIRLLRSYSAFVGVFNIVDLECHRTPAVRHLVGTRAHILSHVKGSVLKMIAHSPLHVAHIDHRVGLNPQGHRLALAVHYPGEILVHALGVLVEERPHASVTSAQCAEVGYGVGLGEVEVLVLAVEIALTAGKVDDIGRI